MDINSTIEKLLIILKEQRNLRSGNNEAFHNMNRLIQSLREESINDNFEGTIEELAIYSEKGLADNNDVTSFLEFNKPNLSRWIEELSMLLEGGGKVTIDYHQRKGREV